MSYQLNTFTFVDEKEMLHFLDKNSHQAHVLLRETSHPATDFFGILIANSSLDEAKLGIGISYYSHGLKPCYLIYPHGAKIFIGYNTLVAFIDLLDRTVQKIIRVDSIIYDILYLADVIILVCEADIIAFTEFGEQIWHFNTDIIEKFEINDGIGYVTYLYDIKVDCLNLMNGTLHNGLED